MMAPTTAMVLAAGFGRRMLPLTETVPKPLVPLGGRPLIDHVLGRLGEAGVARAVVNLHYLGDRLAAHLATRQAPAVVLSDERDALLDTGGGLARALPLLGAAPFYVHNSDTVWLEREPNLARLAEAFLPERMDALLLLAPAAGSLGYAGLGDYALGSDGRIARRRAALPVPHVFAGVSIAHPRLLSDAPHGAFPLTRLWDRAEAAGRLYGLLLRGEWMHIGTPQALAEAEARLHELAA